MNLNLREFAAAMKFFSKALINSKLPKGLWRGGPHRLDRIAA